MSIISTETYETLRSYPNILSHASFGWYIAVPIPITNIPIVINQEWGNYHNPHNDSAHIIDR